MWKKALVTPETPVLKAIDVIDQVGLQIALVVDNEHRLLGTVTDGDVRRALLKNFSLERAVQEIMNPHPGFIYREQPREKAREVMKSRKIRQVPVLDENHRVVGLEIADELLNPPIRKNWVVIMAGGWGRRLTPLTDFYPKPLLKVGGKPVLEIILESFIQQGFRCFYFSVNYKAEMIIQHFGDGSRWGVEIRYLHENRPLGTAGALGLLPIKPQEPLLLINGDILTKMDFIRLLDFHQQALTDVTICIKERFDRIPYGVVTFQKNRLTGLVEKPLQRYFVNAGLYVVNPAVLDYVPSGSRLEIPDLLKTLLNQGKEIAVFPIHEYWIDIGCRDDYERASNEFAEVFK